MKFEYDSRKNEMNIKKHGIDFEEAITVFSDPLLLILENKDDSEEVRNLAIGYSFNRNQLLVVHCIRKGKKNEEIIRIISARKTTRAEKKYFEELQF